MARAISAFSTAVITSDGLATVMRHLGAEPDQWGWKLERKGRVVFVEIGTKYMNSMPQELIEEVVEEAGEWPRSRVVFIFDDSAEDRFESQMARGVAFALAERWPIVLHNHARTAETINPPGRPNT